MLSLAVPIFTVGPGLLHAWQRDGGEVVARQGTLELGGVEYLAKAIRNDD